jgi:hypothetical protein
MRSLQNNVTLDADEDGIWLVVEDNDAKVVSQLGHISWRQIYIYLKKYEEQNESQDRTV